MRELWNRLRDRLHRDRLDRELAEELRFHQRLLERDAASDVSEADARAAARQRLGNLTRTREAARERWSLGALDTLLHDARQTIRGIRKSPGFALAVIVTLALGVGANAAMFGVVDRLMFRPQPYLDDPGSVNRVYLRYRDQGQVYTESDGIEYTRYLDLKRATHTLSAFAAVTQERLAVGSGEDAVVREVAPVSASFFGFFRMRPALGRFFTTAEDSAGHSTPVAVLGYDYWQTAYGGRDVRGKALQVGNVSATIIGVAPRGFSGMSDSMPPAVYLPITAYAESQQGDDATSYYRAYHWGWVELLARRKPGVTTAAASADLTSAFRASWLAQRVLDPDLAPADVAEPVAIASSLKTGAGPDPGAQAKSALWVSGVALIVLLIACANVINLFLVRAMRRRREVAVRIALGVSRGRLLMHHLTESLVLAVLAGVGGMLVAEWGSAGIRHFFGYDSASLSLLTDWRVLAMTGGIVLAIAIVTGVVPALVSDRSDLTGALRSGARSGMRGRARLSNGLLVVQSGLSVMLLVGAGLFVRSMQHVQSLRMGYDADPVLLAIVNARGPRLSDTASMAFSRRLLAAAQAIPGVEHAAWTGGVPFLSRSSTNLAVDGIDSVSRLGRFDYQATTPDYFATMGTRILRGRGLLASDAAGSRRVVVVSQGMAGALWPGRDAIGECLRVGGDTSCTTVVGIAEDAFQTSLTTTKNYHFYLSIDAFRPTSGFVVLLRMRGDAARQAETVRRALQRVMPGEYYVTTQVFRETVDEQRAPWAFGATMFTVLGVLALLVAAVGLYALIAYGVAQRMHELGVRVALGAQRRHIMTLIVSRGLAFAAAGAAIGVVAALVLGRSAAGLLFHESPRDPVVFAAVTILMLLVATIASAVPARRASHADPNTALRAE